MTARSIPQAFPIGSWVRSGYRASWSGIVVGYEHPYGGGGWDRALLVVRQERDRCGRPIRLRRTVRYHWSWFTPIAAPS